MWRHDYYTPGRRIGSAFIFYIVGIFLTSRIRNKVSYYKAIKHLKRNIGSI